MDIRGSGIYLTCLLHSNLARSFVCNARTGRQFPGLGRNAGRTVETKRARCHGAPNGIPLPTALSVITMFFSDMDRHVMKHMADMMVSDLVKDLLAMAFATHKTRGA